MNGSRSEIRAVPGIVQEIPKRQIEGPNDLAVLVDGEAEEDDTAQRQAPAYQGVGGLYDAGGVLGNVRLSFDDGLELPIANLGDDFAAVCRVQENEFVQVLIY